MVSEKVLHRDTSDLKERFHLMRFWRAEEKIIAGLKQIIRKENPEIEIKMDGWVELTENVWFEKSSKKIP